MENKSHKIIVAFMLGLSDEHELSHFKAFLANPDNIRALSNFDKVIFFIRDNELFDEFRKELSLSNIESTSLELVKFYGGSHIGRNRADVIDKIKHRYPICSVMFKDIDDDFIRPDTVWKLITDTARRNRDSIIEYNHGAFDNLDDLPEYKGLFVVRDPGLVSSYDNMSGYKFVNDKLRVSGINKLFPIYKLNTELLRKLTRYEDSIVFADMYSKEENIIVLPELAGVYNRENSGVFTDSSLGDDGLDYVIELATKISVSKTDEECKVPFNMLTAQISAWKDHKKLKSNDLLIGFSGLAWNYKTTIVRELMERESEQPLHQLVQVNKSKLAESPNLSPKELKEIFLFENSNLLNSEGNIITDRIVTDYLFYELLMDPKNNWNLDSEILNSSEDKDEKFLLEAVLELSAFTKGRSFLWVTLENADYKFIENSFIDNYSSTSMLFDNKEKYYYYSKRFMQLTDRLDYYLTKQGLEYTHLHYKKYSSESIPSFTSRVVNDINRIINETE